MKTGNELRQLFLEFFESNAHTKVASGSLIPQNDPTLFFTNAGMVPFKDVFTGKEKRDYTRATSSQKCLRVSGKHNDLENVGRTPRHHTFFEMLGNFSFGDYFKKDAIRFAWEFLTKIVKLDTDPLWVTIFENDDEAEKLWIEEVNFPKNKIIRCGEKDNFWSMGETGPCGPCSEIHVDIKAYFEGKKSQGNPLTHPDDFLEIWNLVFMQFNRDAKGTLTPLPSPSIDTGMGLERLAAVVQKKRSNFETDLFLPLIESLSQQTGKKYGENSEQDVSLRVLADHIRAATFLIGDGIQPSNEGRGYILRRILRRAIRHGKLLGAQKPFLFEATNKVIEMMGKAYPDLKTHLSFIQKVVFAEEERFLATLDNGLAILSSETEKLKKAGKKIIPGELVFKLYDTFGFPTDLTEIIAQENSLTVDIQGFENEMENQKEKARANWKGSGEKEVGAAYHELSSQKLFTQFTGYETLNGDSTITALIAGNKKVTELKNGESGEIFTKISPFYAESGGQAGDKGVIVTDRGVFSVQDTQKPLDGLISHKGKILSGSLKIGDLAKLQVDEALRKPTMKNHTATHLLHSALRKVLGDHVKQAGSVVDSERLRFDFSHFEPVSHEQIVQIEKMVNDVIQSNISVQKEEMSLDEAKKKGALAFFGEKYGERVRVVTAGSFSMEFCGGTHLNAVGEIGCLKITRESSVASGVRRIEALTGPKALELFQKYEDLLSHTASALKSTPDEIPARISKMADKIKELEKEVQKLKAQGISGTKTGEDYLTKIEKIGETPFLYWEVSSETNQRVSTSGEGEARKALPSEGATQAPIIDTKILRDLSDTMINRIKTGVLVLIGKSESSVLMIVRVSKDLPKFNAGKIVQELAPLIGGKGGGRPDMAQAGGNDTSKLSTLQENAKKILGA